MGTFKTEITDLPLHQTFVLVKVVHFVVLEGQRSGTAVSIRGQNHHLHGAHFTPSSNAEQCCKYYQNHYLYGAFSIPERQ